tara:strand:+ start:228 stop:473 length:246 start_codon:yes stop_codon:yes gene_type:complete
MILGTSLLEATRARLIGEITSARANLEVLLQNPVGIGEHTDLVEDVYCYVDVITSKEDMLDQVEEIILEKTTGSCVADLVK